MFTGPASIDGKWAEGFSIPGGFFQMDLSGAGDAAIEHFDGIFTSANTIKGTITTDAPGQVIGHTSYSRVP